MNAETKRVLVSVAIALMFIVPLSIFVSDGSDADSVDYSKWYYNQLSDDAKKIYDGFEGLKSGTTNQFTIDGTYMYPEYADKKISDISSGRSITVTSSTLLPAMNAAKMDDPELYWTNMHINMKIEGTNVSGSKVTMTVETIDGIPYNKTGDVMIQSVIDSAIADGDLNVDSSLNFITKTLNIHNYIVNKLSYATSALNVEKTTGVTNDVIRSTYTAFTDDEVVCEGYAKAFKYLCDMYDIPCITVVGDANNGSSTEGHMWNLVQGDDSNWYTVDCTWDDPVNGSERTSYFMVGQKTKVGTLTVAQSHNMSTTTSYGFSLPALSDKDYDREALRVTLSFETNGGSAITSQRVKIGDSGVRPDNPKFVGHAFYNWYIDSDLTIPWNWNTKLIVDTTIYAKWTELPTYSVTFMANGGKDAPDTIVVYEGDYAEIPETEPTRDKYKFVEWNTKDDGTGTSYKPGNMLAPMADITLYAIWEEVPSDDFISGLIGAIDVESFLSDSIDPYIKDLEDAWNDFVAKSEEFLGKPWIGGIPNLYFVIGGAVIFFIIAVLATRKN